jgi:cytochrome c biogenesis protein CcdA
MASLLAVLGSIGLLDSTSMFPLAIPILLAFLAGPRPYGTCIAFLVGIFAVYFPSGILLTLGLEALLEPLQGAVEEWMRNPGTAALLIQIAVGVVMVAFGWKLAYARDTRGDRGAGEGLSPGAAFGLGAGSMLVGMPGAFPYFAAVDQIVRSDPSVMGASAQLLYYNAVFLLPLAALPILRATLGARADGFFARLAPLVERWGHRMVVAVLVGVGIVGVADGVGWLLGRPLLPVPQQP